jgi:hypothetical protein
MKDTDLDKIRQWPGWWGDENTELTNLQDLKAFIFIFIQLSIFWL